VVSWSIEGQLVALVRRLFGPATHPLDLTLHESWPAPAKLSPEGLRVLEDTLGKGAVLWLTRQGAWRERLWAKRQAPPLHFDSATVPLLTWLLEQPLSHEGVTPLRLGLPGSLGCELVLLAAVATALDTPSERQLVSQAAVQRSPLCRLAFPVALALGGGELSAEPLVLTEAQDFVLEALQAGLARWWREAERLKARLLMPADVQRVGLSQARLLDQLFAWAEANDRRERCTFVLEAMAPLVHERATPADFVSDFDESLPLRDRHAARRAAGAVLHGVQRLQQWDQAARTVRFIDDGYDAAQARVKTYEAVFGAQRFFCAQRLRDALDALPS
jgi:hypothetical protein